MPGYHRLAFLGAILAFGVRAEAESCLGPLFDSRLELVEQEGAPHLAAIVAPARSLLFEQARSPDGAWYCLVFRVDGGELVSECGPRQEQEQ